MLKYQGLLKTSMRPMLKPCVIPMAAHARTISSSRAQQSKTPTAPLVLGAAGLLPFVGTAAVSAVMPETVFLMMEVQAVYSTTILSFMGAVHWGLAMAPGSNATAASTSNIGAPETASSNEGSLTQSEAARYALSTVPALVAFASVVTCNVPTSLFVHAVGYNALLAFDMAAGRRGLVPAWYPGLRLWLTGVVTASIASTLFIAYRRETEEESEEASEEEER
ncbi:hypothetical protein HDU78_007982 [Chytriomyces hyalinus]|nr:hypothetical protein HDU78_007982 [Chytriomyces hyalinus]KAJ3253028.1 hypothetical protein HDU77_004761 [Chytriomyces hyalinus]